MFNLTFNPDKMPRTMTRQQWRELSSWLRLCRRQILAVLDRETA